MPTRVNDDGTPIVTFDALLEISPFTLFKRLREERSMLLVDVREEPGEVTLAGAIVATSPTWTPDDPNTDVVLFDGDGSLALEIAGSLQKRGYGRVRALFGGLDLYEFALDPQVVGEETYLVAGDRRQES